MNILFRLPLRPFLPKAALPARPRVLLVRDDVIGDLIVPTSAVVKWLLERGYDVHLVLRRELMDVGRLLLPQDKLIPVDIKLYRKSLRYRFSFLQSLRKTGFGCAIGSLIHSSVNDDIVRSSGAPARWGYKRNGKLKERLRLRGLRKVDSLPGLEAGAEQYTSVVEHERHFLENIFQTGIDAESFGPAVRIASEADNSLPPRYIHYLAEAGAVKRVFPPERLLPVLLPIARRAGLQVVLTGLREITFEDPACLNLTGRTTLAEAIGIVNQAELVIGNESGLAHLAWVLGKKTAIFYGGGHCGRFRPAPGVLLLNVPCQFRCCDWKCRYDGVPVPCVNLDEAELRESLERFILSAD